MSGHSKRRMMIPEEEAKRQAQKAKHARDRAAGRCCSSNHYGCTVQGPHTHGTNPAPSGGKAP